MAGFFVVISYHAFWNGARIVGHPLSTSWNIPGFIFAVGSMPWSWPVVNFMHEIESYIGHISASVLTIVFITFGFAINLTIVMFVIAKIVTYVKEEINNTKNKKY
ncbi:hypothetical protein [Zooshikella sp. RANM57]|uniref:hypothetical protein n=1 Tax=Zooshikella sp. RANM57 TaxID=3425863 RepID=UPI003D6DC07A